MKGFVYSLRDPKSDIVFYVGQTILPIKKRLAQHIAQAKYFPSDCKRCEIINNIILDGGEPIISILEEVVCEEKELYRCEKKWIKDLSKSFTLTNIVGNTNHKKRTFLKEAEELKQLLKDVSAPISNIEKFLGIPATVLQKSLKGERGLPKEWVIRLQEFVEKKQYIGLRRKPRNVPKKGTVIKDIIKNLQELPPITNLSTLKDFNNTNEIPRLEGEGSLDYRIRCAELNAKK